MLRQQATSLHVLPFYANLKRFNTPTRQVEHECFLQIFIYTKICKEHPLCHDLGQELGNENKNVMVSSPAEQSLLGMGGMLETWVPVLKEVI